MTYRSKVWALVQLGGLICGAGACRGPGWQAGPSLLVTPRDVAAALNDPVDPGRKPFDPSSVPVVEPPRRVRPCCAFGSDLKAKLGAVPVPGYEIGNIVSADELGPHEYNNGKITVRPGQQHQVVLENNGLVYTCRGGFIDTAHIRDNADRVLYATMQLARWLPAANAQGTTFDFPEEGTLRRVVVKPVPEALLQRQGRWRTAAQLAGWIDFQLSVWHEIITWYGWESTKGFSEKISAFSPEDLYSNVLGLRIAMGILTSHEALSRDDYNHALDAWMPAALHSLGAVQREQGRAAMAAVDGRWWDSKKALPDWKLVTRRYMDVSSPLSGWLVQDAFAKGEAPQVVQQMCAHAPAPLPLEVPESLRDTKISDLVTIELQFSGWIPDHFPLPADKGAVVRPHDFGKIIEAIRREAERDLGAGFDHPGPVAARLASLVSWLAPPRPPLAP